MLSVSITLRMPPAPSLIRRAAGRGRGEDSGGGRLFKKKRGNRRFDCDWSSDVCSSDLPRLIPERSTVPDAQRIDHPAHAADAFPDPESGGEGKRGGFGGWPAL